MVPPFDPGRPDPA